MSSASLGGSFQRAASAAKRRMSSWVSPAWNTGVCAWMTILFSVSVPVLSLHSMLMPASSSMAASRDTMALRPDSSRLPSAIVVVVTTSMAIGIDATSSTTTYAMLCRNGSPRMSR